MSHRTETYSLSGKKNSLVGALRQGIGTIVLIAVSCLTITTILVATNGDIFIAMAALIMVAIVLVTAYRVEIGYYILVGCVLAFDQYQVPEFTSFTGSTGYFLNLKELPHLAEFGAGVLNPLEMHLLLLILAWAMVIIFKREFFFHRVPLWGTAGLFFLSLALSFARGMSSGGDMLPALWEVRALFYLGILYFFTPQVIRTREQLFTFFWICIVIITFKAFQGAERWIEMGLDFQGLTTLTNHEDALFFLSMFILFFCLWFWKSNRGQRRLLTALMLVLLVGFYVAQRRAAYAAIGPSVLVIVILLSPRDRWRFAKIALPILAVVVVYCAAFWNSDNAFGAPVRLVKSGISLKKETAGARYFSNLYREKEKYDLAVTARHAVVAGIGFGKKYEMPIKLVKIPFTLRDYIGHNAILWLFVKLGAAGFFFFCVFLDSFMVYGASLFARLVDPYLKTICVVILTVLVSQVVVSYYDLQLTYYRNMVYLGALLGMLPVIESLHQQTLRTTGGDIVAHASPGPRGRMPVADRRTAPGIFFPVHHLHRNVAE